MPLYGYNSFTFDEVAVGARMIQGTFIINYLIPNYLAKLVRTNAKSTSVAAEDKKSNDQSDAGKKTTTAATAMISQGILYTHLILEMEEK